MTMIFRHIVLREGGRFGGESMQDNDTGGREHRLATQIKFALLREALNRRVVTPQQFSHLMELQRGR